MDKILNELPYAIVIVDIEARVVSANRTMAKIFGNTQESLVGVRCGDVLNCGHHLDSPEGCGFSDFCKVSCGFRKLITNTLEAWKPIDTEIEFDVHGIKQKQYFKVRALPTERNGQKCFMFCIENVTTEKILAKQKEENEKLHGALLTAGAICHEINNPLTVINFQLELISKENISIEAVKILKKHIGRIEETIKKLGNIVRVTETDYTSTTKILDIDLSSKE